MQSSYENAPGTIMLATHCAACGKALVDAVSVESGMGPDCREKYGRWPAEVDRAAANKLVHDIALRQSCSLADIKALYDMGALTIASRVAGRFATLHVDREGDTLLVWTPKYNENVVETLRRVPRQWDANRKVYVVQSGFAQSLIKAISTLPGWGYGSKGPFALAC